MHRRAVGRVVFAVGLVARLDVVLPTDLMLEEQVGQVRPGVVRLAAGGVGVGRVLQPVDATHGIPGLAALGRPLGDHVEVGGETPRGVRLEHVVLQDELLGVGPVVGDLPRVVVAHHVRAAAGRAGRQVGVDAAPDAALRLGNEAVHLAAVDVGDGVGGRVRPAVVEVGGVVVGVDAGVVLGVGDADGELAVLGGEAVGAGEGAEVGVEGAVLLHDDDDVLDLVDALGGRRAARRGGRDGAAGGGEEDHGHDERVPVSPGVSHVRSRPRGHAAGLTVR